MYLKLIVFIFLLLTKSVVAKDFQLEKVIDLDDPWGLTFVDKDHVLITEKQGSIIFLNIKSKVTKTIKHNLNYKVDGQGGLLDIIKHQNEIFICYSEDRGNGRTSTSIAKASFSTDQLKFKNIFSANPPINSGFHFGCRLVIKDNYLYASAGERGGGNIAQDPSNHIGKIIRIHLDGSIPKDNPKYKGKTDWLGEVYQIGIRNPQGMTLSPFNNKIYISNHGAKGGDFFGEVKFAENYGWQIWCWGGLNYNNSKCGEVDQPDSRFTKPLYTWTPSIAVSAVQIYKGKEFKEWENHILMTALKDESLRKLKFLDQNKVGEEEVLIKDKIGRIRDLKIDEQGKIYMLTNGRGALWVMSK